MDNQAVSKIVYLNDLPFVLPIIPQPVPPFQCCNGIHKGVGCDEQIVAKYPEVEEINDVKQIQLTSSAQKRVFNDIQFISLQTPENKKSKSSNHDENFNSPSLLHSIHPSSKADSQNR